MNYYDYYEIESTLKANKGAIEKAAKINVPPGQINFLGINMTSIRPTRTPQTGAELGSIRSYLNEMKGSGKK